MEGGGVREDLGRGEGRRWEERGGDKEGAKRKEKREGSEGVKTEVCTCIKYIPSFNRCCTAERYSFCTAVLTEPWT